MISRISDEISEIPAKPDFLLKISITSATSEIPVLAIMCGITDASNSPVRVPIMTPASGVKPIEVSTDLPPSTAVKLTPLPI